MGKEWKVDGKAQSSLGRKVSMPRKLENRFGMVLQPFLVHNSWLCPVNVFWRGVLRRAESTTLGGTHLPEQDPVDESSETFKVDFVASKKIKSKNTHPRF